MPKANIVLADGTKVTIEGNADEVAAILQRISTAPPGSALDSGEHRARRRRRKSKPSPGAVSSMKSKAKGPADYIRELMAENYFKAKRGLAEVQQALEERAHIYPVTSLSPALFRLVKAKELRRIKEDGAWKYVNP
jgi:hypothetical protein